MFRRRAKSRRVDARQSDTRSLTDPRIAVTLGGLESWDGFRRAFTQMAKPDGGAPANVGSLVLESLDQSRHGLGGFPLPLRQETNRNDAILLLG